MNTDESGGMYVTPAMKGVHYASIAITVIFAFCALFGVIGSITVSTYNRSNIVH